jgi:site-specific DNA-methyltransferase (adenine-specific)
VEREQIGACTLYRGDCLEVLPTLGGIDAVIADPPYGMGFDWTKNRPRRTSTLVGGSSRLTHMATSWSQNVTNDDQPFDPRPWLMFQQIILWGGNHYASRLPDSAGWLVWDKRDGGTSDSFSDCELAWTNLGTRTRIHHQLWRGVVRRGIENTMMGPKLHPTQKPLELMRWCVPMTTGSVLDPYMGSGTTGVACVQLGRAFVGIEIEPHYFDIACQRITDAYAQPNLFVPQPTRPEQQALFVGGR